MLRVEQEVVLGSGGQLGVFFRCFLIQPAAQLVAVPGIQIVLHRVGGAAHTVRPPVGEVAVVNRGIRQLGSNGGIELLEGDHPDLNLSSIAAVVLLNGFQNLPLRGCVVTENAGNGGDNKIVAVAVGFAQVQVLC